MIVFCFVSIKCCEACVECKPCIQTLKPNPSALQRWCKKYNMLCPKYLADWTMYGAAFFPSTTTMLVSKMMSVLLAINTLFASIYSKLVFLR